MIKNKKSTVVNLALTGLMGALVYIATMFFKVEIPVGADRTMIGFANVFCVLSGLILGPAYGGLAAGVGSFLFDITGGWFSSAGVTLFDCLERKTGNPESQPFGHCCCNRFSGLLHHVLGTFFLPASDCRQYRRSRSHYHDDQSRRYPSQCCSGGCHCRSAVPHHSDSSPAQSFVERRKTWRGSISSIK